MATSGALKSTKRAKSIIKDLNIIKNEYIYYYLGHNHAKFKELEQLFDRIEDFIVEMSAEKRIIQAEVAKKIKKEI